MIGVKMLLEKIGRIGKRTKNVCIGENVYLGKNVYLEGKATIDNAIEKAFELDTEKAVKYHEAMVIIRDRGYADSNDPAEKACEMLCKQVYNEVSKEV